MKRSYQKLFCIRLSFSGLMDSHINSNESSIIFKETSIQNSEQKVSQNVDYWPWMKTEIWYTRFENFMMEYKHHPKVVYD